MKGAQNTTGELELKHFFMPLPISIEMIYLVSRTFSMEVKISICIVLYCIFSLKHLILT